MFEKESSELRADVKKLTGFKMPKNKLTVEQAHEQLEAAKKKDD